MRRSKLEIYIDILEVLASKGPLKITHIMHKANVCYDILKQCLHFLIEEQNLIEKRISDDRKVVYAITQRGLAVLKNFRQLRMTILLIEEKRKVPLLLY